MGPVDLVGPFREVVDSVDDGVDTAVEHRSHVEHVPGEGRDLGGGGGGGGLSRFTLAEKSKPNILSTVSLEQALLINCTCPQSPNSRFPHTSKSRND